MLTNQNRLITAIVIRPGNVSHKFIVNQFNLNNL
jgi:hypothetical protein